MSAGPATTAPALKMGGRRLPPWVATTALLLPAYGWLLIAIFLPLGAMFLFSFMTATPIGNKEIGYTLDQYKIFFTQPYMWQVASWTFQIAFATTLICALAGFLAALALARSGLGRSQWIFLILILLPFWTNGLVRIFSWTMVIREGGFLDAVVQFVLPEAGSVGFLYSRPAIVLGLVHGYLPYMVLTCYIAISTIDDAIVEAAESLGARWWTVLGRILIPMAAPGLIAGSVLIFVPVVGAFMEPRILGGPQGVTLGTVIEDSFTQGFNWPQGAALSFMLLAVVLAIFATFSGVLRRNAQW
ncbi:ABC transporter permease [Pseudogemmobacter bohemicus]|uniref:ABC transporter permease n=1 Tax=Pseudogemmobacter bohemicus TaxID=2250708 RepID=UPI001E30D53B|nr:ABC transporter permease [Pseudogemmobacter bohemicus]